MEKVKIPSPFILERNDFLMEYNRKQKSLSPIDILKFGTVNTGTTFKQYDINTSILELELVANGEPVHLKDEKVYVTVKSSSNSSTQLISKYSGVSTKEKDNYKVLLRAKKSRRRDVNNIIDVYISPLALENSGEMIAEVMIIDLIKEERVTSQSFTFNIESSITPNRPSESAYKIVKDLDGTYITDAEDVQLLVAEVEPNFKLSFVGTRVNEILEKANNFDIEDNTNKIQSLQEKDVELESKISNLEQKDSSLDGEIASLKSSNQSIEEEIQGLKTKDESIESEISQLKSKDTLIDGEIDKLKNADETIKEDINSKYEELKQKTDSTNNEIVRLKTQDTTLSESIRTNKGLIDVINPKVATLEQDSQNVKNRVSVLEGDMNLAKSNISTLQRSNTELSQKVEGVEQGNASINEILEQLQRDVESYKSSIELLESKVPVWKDFKGESFKVENSFYGKSRDLSIKGKTLFNIFKWKGEFNGSFARGVETSFFKPSTKYTIFHNTKSLGLKDYIVFASELLTNQYELKDGNVFTTKDSIPQNSYFHAYNIGEDSNIPLEKFNQIKVLILEGDWTGESAPSYFEGIKSLGEQEGNKISILSSGINLIIPPKKNVIKTFGEVEFKMNTDNTMVLNGNSEITGGRTVFSGVTPSIFLEKGKTYTLSANTENISGIFLNRVSDNKTYKGAGTFVAEENIEVYIGVNLKIMNYNNEIIYPMLVEGNNLKPFTPYECNKKDISLQPLGFDGGLKDIYSVVYDELNDVSGVAIKRVGKYTFTGDETILDWRGTPEDGYCYFYIDNLIDNNLTSNNIISDRFIRLSSSQTGKEGISLRKAGDFSRIYFSIDKTKISPQNDTGFKAWLKANSTTVYYELAEPVVKPLSEDINFGTLDDVTYVSLENNIKNELSCQCQVSLASSKV